MGTPPSFSAMFSKGDNFCDFLCLLTWMGASSFLHELTPIYMGGNNENDRVASPKVYPYSLRLDNWIEVLENGHSTIFIWLLARIFSLQKYPKYINLSCFIQLLPYLFGYKMGFSPL